MDVDHATDAGSDDRVADQAHISGTDDEIGLNIVDAAEQGFIVGHARVVIARRK